MIPLPATATSNSRSASLTRSGWPGLSQSDGNVHFNSIDFALRFNANDSVDVMENGQYQGGDSYYQPGDRFRVAVMGGRVRYMQNGNVIFESRQPARYPLVLRRGARNDGVVLRNARMDTNNRAFTSNDYYMSPTATRAIRSPVSTAMKTAC